MEIIQQIRSSKDIADAIDDAKREIINLFRTHKRLTDLDVSLYLEDGTPKIRCSFEEYVER